MSALASSMFGVVKGSRHQARAGECWNCGCTDDDACRDPLTNTPCEWADEAQTFCSLCAIIYALPIVEAIAQRRELDGWVSPLLA